MTALSVSAAARARLWPGFCTTKTNLRLSSRFFSPHHRSELLIDFCLLPSSSSSSSFSSYSSSSSLSSFSNGHHYSCSRSLSPRSALFTPSISFSQLYSSRTSVSPQHTSSCSPLPHTFRRHATTHISTPKIPAAFQYHHRTHPLFPYLFLLPFFAGILGVCYCQSNNSEEEVLQPKINPRKQFKAMQALPGRPGNLTAEQEEKLRQLWVAVLKICQVASDEDDGDAGGPSSPGTSTPVSATGSESVDKNKDKKFKNRLKMFQRSKSSKQVGDQNSEASASSTSLEPNSTKTAAGGDDKYGQTAQFLATIEKESPAEIRQTIWDMVKHDDPDALLLRFLRARKWDVEKALVMFISTMTWRHREMKVDEVIMREGEVYPSQRAKAADVSESERKMLNDFMAQMRKGKSFIFGSDKKGRPVCVVRVKLHKPNIESEESLERYTVYLIETARMLLTSAADQAVLIFDMTGFSLANMDYAPVKFMIKCFEANYPESLGAVLIHNAPWVFQGVMRVIRGWLDPVVVSKLHFTNSIQDIETYVAPEHLSKQLRDTGEWEFEWIEPQPDEDDRLKDTQKRDELQKKRNVLTEKFEQLTIKWSQHSSGDQAQAITRERAEVRELLRKNYWELDPYIRGRSLYDRIGMLREGGEVVMFPGKTSAHTATATEANNSGDLA